LLFYIIFLDILGFI